jgi:transcriptional regulator with XRE-family HTH domain
VKVRCHLREIRGRRGLREISEACGINRGLLSRVETGRVLPQDNWIEAMEMAYGAPFADWYPPLTIRVLELDEVNA